MKPQQNKTKQGHCAYFLECIIWGWTMELSSLAPGRDLDAILKMEFVNLVLLIGIFRSSHDIALRWMPQDFTDDKSTLVQVMAWCRQAPSHHLSQCWLSSLSPYGVTRPQWVKWLFLNSLSSSDVIWHRWSGSSLFQLMVCHLFGAKSLP